LIGESDRALCELMRRALEAADYAIMESGSALQLEGALRTNHVAHAPRALLVVSIAMFEACSAAVEAFTRRRAVLGLPAPHVLLTCEFGTHRNSSPPDFGECFSVGILEKPFDLTLLQGIAYRCRTSSQVSRVSL
jgi:hypothetical protein